MAFTSTINQQQVTLFDGSNYEYWSIQMKTVLRAFGVWEVVESGIPTTKPNEEESTVGGVDWQKKDAEALAKIHLATTDLIFPRIMNATSAKQAWDTLQREFQGTERMRIVKLQSLQLEFDNLKMKKDESIKDYSTRVIEIVNQLKAMGEDINDRRVVQKMLLTLSKKFNLVAQIIEESKDITTLSLADFLGSLQIHEQRMNIRDDETTSEGPDGAFQSRHNPSSSKPHNNPRGDFKHQNLNNNRERNQQGKFPPCNICKKTNHEEKNCWHKGKPQCNYCKKFGHTENVCRFKKQQASISETVDEESYLFYANQSNTIKKNDWLIDSGCTNHMTKQFDIFTNIDKYVKIPIRMGNGSMVKSEGKGTVAVQTKQGTRFIKDVLYVPGLNQNLLSVPQMVQNGYSIHFKDESCAILDPQKNKIANVKMQHKRFPLNWQYEGK
ncbi:uncharacterized protein LOC110715866 [Chenopodium quinoa]|uniref:uncharacterized protein LOC110715866 n=1 Tax=Chenopodium quinoa TaxID=63459 RepID=UPI000B78030F|nr:uncharacterized protein LOC110715866 [Chenopodium quinoa]